MRQIGICIGLEKPPVFRVKRIVRKSCEQVRSAQFNGQTSKFIGSKSLDKERCFLTLQKKAEKSLIEEGTLLFRPAVCLPLKSCFNLFFYTHFYPSSLTRSNSSLAILQFGLQVVDKLAGHATGATGVLALPLQCALVQFLERQHDFAQVSQRLDDAQVLPLIG